MSRAELGQSRPVRSKNRRTRVAALISAPLLTGLFALTLSSSPLISTASAAPVSINQCNGTDNVGGEGVACDATITNTFDIASSATSSTVTLQVCHGAANAPLTCTTNTSSSPDLTTSVTQCNGSGSGGGGEVRCNVTIVNNITGTVSPTPASINQCNGSGTGGGTQPTVSCSPIGSTTSATVNQCNSAGNGGGATIRVQCNVDPSTQTAALAISIDQCNGSGNGGGATVTCRSSVTNNVTAAAASPTPAPSTTGTPSPTPTATAIPVVTPTPTSTSSPSPTPGAVTDTGTPTSSATPTAVTARGTTTSLVNTGADSAVTLAVALFMMVLGAQLVVASARTPQKRGRHSRA